MRTLTCLALAMIAAVQSFATESMDLDVRLLHRRTGKPYKGVRLIVYSIYSPVSEVTDRNGHCRLTYGFSISGGKNDWKTIYAIRKPGDNVLLKRFNLEPRSFKLLEDQHYSTTF